MELSSPRSTEELINYAAFLDEELPPLPETVPDGTIDPIAYKNYMLLRFERQKRNLLEAEQEIASPRTTRAWSELSDQVKHAKEEARREDDEEQLYFEGDLLNANWESSGIHYEAVVERVEFVNGVHLYTMRFVDYPDKVERCLSKDLEVRPQDECERCGFYFPRRCDTCPSCDAMRGRDDDSSDIFEETLDDEFVVEEAIVREKVGSPRLTCVLDDLAAEFDELAKLEDM